MQRISFDREWVRVKEAPAMFWPMQGHMGNKAVTVNLPDDCNLDEPVAADCPDGSQVAYFKGNMAVYTKRLQAPEEWKDSSVYLELDGAYCNAEITVNGHLVAMHPSGYAPFHCEISDCLNFGEENRIAVFVNNSMMRTARWYSGTGLYRHVDLRVGPKAHLAVDPIFVQTVSADADGALLKAEIEVENRSFTGKRLRAEVTVHEDRGHGEEPSEQVSGRGTADFYIDKNASCVQQCTIYVKHANLWSVEEPNLYVAKVKLYEAEQQIDEDETLFGIRTLTMDAQHGMRVNGKPYKIRGGCMHHDNGLLGAASFYDSEYRRLALHKKNGFNGVRCAHNPMSRDMMEACDRLGLFVYAEAFDVWRMQKNLNDYHTAFESWWERDLTAFVKRDRNHPSIVIWSIGNEIGERNGLKDGASYARLLSDKAHALDATRPVSAAVPTLFNGMNDADTVQQLQSMMSQGGPGQNLSTPYAQEIWADRTNDFCAPLDVVGYNYLDMRYESDHALYPDRIICGTESYPSQIDRVWALVEKLPYVIGDFTWTSQDYLGETGCGKIAYRDPSEPPVSRAELQSGNLFPSRTANCSDFDICGNDMPALHYRKIVWGSDETYLAVMDPKNYGKTAYRTSWAWDECDNHWYYPEYEGKPIQVVVYSGAEEVELFVNGVSVGRKPAGKDCRYQASFDTIYHGGCVEAVSYTDGTEISRQTLTTPGAPAELRLSPEKLSMKADGQSLIFVPIELTDEEGRRIPTMEEPLHASAEGVAVLAAFGAATPVTEELYTTGEFTSYRGRAMAVLRSTYASGEARLTVESKHFGTKTITVTVG